MPQDAVPEPPGPGARRSLKQGFFEFSERFGHLMSRVLLTLLYALLVAPGGLALALLGDPLRIRRYAGTSWVDWQSRNENIEQARRQDR